MIQFESIENVLKCDTPSNRFLFTLSVLLEPSNKNVKPGTGQKFKNIQL